MLLKIRSLPTLLDSLWSSPAGKTTLLRYLLQNAEGLKIGCIINDVAGVNVDAKLVRNDRSRGGEAKTDSTSDLTDTLELANGCACESFFQSASKACCHCNTPFMHKGMHSLTDRLKDNSICHRKVLVMS